MNFINLINLIERYPADIKTHAMRVSVLASGYGRDYELIGLLHDIIEDTDTTLDELPVDIRDDIDILTRKNSETYFEYINRIVNSNKRAIIIKCCDIYDHLQCVDTLTDSLKKRYDKAYFILLKALFEKCVIND
jgi:(p)ppGpp synthase/HD superfamily hydrolase